MIAPRVTVERPLGDICRFARNAVDPRDARCDREITLDGITYRCARFSPAGRCHEGVHDANLKHSDGGLVRW